MSTGAHLTDTVDGILMSLPEGTSDEKILHSFNRINTLYEAYTRAESRILHKLGNAELKNYAFSHDNSEYQKNLLDIVGRMQKIRIRLVK